MPFQKGNNLGIKFVKGCETGKEFWYQEGHVFSPDVIEKLRKAKRGKKLSEEHKKNISLGHIGKSYGRGRIPWNKGLKGVMKPNSGCFKKGNIPWVQGKKNPCSEEQRKKLSLVLSREKNPAWQGGISKRPYPFDFTKELKELIRRRDDYKCQICRISQEESARTLPVHHIDYNKVNLDPDNLITLCYSCHGKTMHKREYWEPFLRSCVNAL